MIISESTYKEVQDHFVCRELDLIRVMGKQEPVRIYEVRAKQPADARPPPLARCGGGGGGGGSTGRTHRHQSGHGLPRS